MHVKDYLEYNDVSVWFDRRNLRCTEGSLHHQLAKGIEESEYFLCFVTKKYDNSENCRLEFHWSRKLGKKQVIIMLEKVDTSLLSHIGIMIEPQLRINYYQNNDPQEIFNCVKVDVGRNIRQLFKKIYFIGK